MEVILSILAFLIAGLIQGITGFGFALVAAPVLMLFMDPQHVTPTVITVCLLPNLIVLADTRRSVRLRMVLPVLIGGLIGLPLGAYILSTIEPAPFKIAVGVIVLILSVVMLFGWKRPVRNVTAGLVPVGFMSGVLSTSTSIGGPPLVLFLANQGVPRDIFRANLVGYFTILNFCAIVTMILYGFLTMKVLTALLIYIPVAFIGSISGVYLARVINEKLFSKIVLVFIFILGIVLIASNIG
jgi:uncharacterized membrane protein YfcA